VSSPTGSGSRCGSWLHGGSPTARAVGLRAPKHAGVHPRAADDEAVGLVGRHAPVGEKGDELWAGVDGARRAAPRLRHEQRCRLRERQQCERCGRDRASARSGVCSDQIKPATASVASSGSLGTSTLRPVPGLRIVIVVASLPAAAAPTVSSRTRSLAWLRSASAAVAKTSSGRRFDIAWTQDPI